ncbi:usg protein [Hansschlegelia plantiphila]|uniref:Usg family protein n=1 Tax=Hansschlegelia plantiphila TaxID=374655 RepID=A0A9W6IZU4_9HYPH|nr:usg protein [Hansschlegelia plantiphila]GLK66680.1 Usg family protein [Hansschlegelia plantiphila]
MSGCGQPRNEHDGGRSCADFKRQIDGYGLTTAEILYRMPDHPALLQTFLWQQYDKAPDYPVLRGFLDWWRREIEGMLHSVRVGHKALIGPADFEPVRAEFLLN